MKKHYKTTDNPRATIKRGDVMDTVDKARAAVQRMNGGLPRNLHMCSRQMLLKVIKDQQEELIRLRLRS